ncbi:Integral membrane protein [Winogradskyella psychrotolerans RS-3]|uniref:Integral membrane protein n=1 Tax=Winogradskyella psychrotolerans RS-3 TaxID=641526 RepID=S7VML3_9FLAO|nr:EamA family transporter [Winogradskyella psychrotolerans]EPR70647.1 Integral membrane protein [Winogradskyella psychrotolerans RS-3]
MIYLLISILASTAIFVVFKLFKKYGVNTLHGIVVNYFTACFLGFLLYNGSIEPSEIIKTNWFIPAICLGFLFIAIFNVMALTAQKNGLSVASVASKMSVIIPVIFGIIVFKESVGAQKIIGILLALVAVYLTSVKQKDNTILTQSIYLPVILFLGSGIIDTSINYFAPNDKIALFSATIFAMAAIIGVILLLGSLFKSKVRFKFISIPFGIALGIVNYGSIHFLLMALRVENTESSTLFTINHIAILALSTLIGLVLFKEKISKKNWIGIMLALISILLVTLA